VCLKSKIFPQKIETLFSSLANLSPLQKNLRCEEIILLCSPSMGHHFIIKKNQGKVSHGWGVVGASYSTTCVSYDRHPQPQIMLLPLSPWHNDLS
jgi:hypothetical protein